MFQHKAEVHRGTDFGMSSSGIHLHLDPTHVEKVISPVKTKTSITPSKKDLPKINSWVDSVAVNDNDMIYLRKKNGIIYVMKVEPHLTGKWEKLDPTAIPLVTDVHGAKLEDVSLASLREELVTPKKEELRPIPNLTLGWYQDDKANLYKYLGGGVWDSDIGLFGKLLVKAEAGELEYLG